MLCGGNWDEDDSRFPLSLQNPSIHDLGDVLLSVQQRNLPSARPTPATPTQTASATHHAATPPAPWSGSGSGSGPASASPRLPRSREFSASSIMTQRRCADSATESRTSSAARSTLVAPAAASLSSASRARDCDRRSARSRSSSATSPLWSLAAAAAAVSSLSNDEFSQSNQTTERSD